MGTLNQNSWAANVSTEGLNVILVKVGNGREATPTSINFSWNSALATIICWLQRNEDDDS